MWRIGKNRGASGKQRRNTLPAQNPEETHKSVVRFLSKCGAINFNSCCILFDVYCSPHRRAHIQGTYMHTHTHAHMHTQTNKNKHNTHIFKHACSYLIQRLSSCAHHVLHYNVAVYEMRSNPGWVEHSPRLVQEHNAHHVIAYVSLFINLHTIQP